MSELSSALERIGDGDVFVTATPDVADFTDPKKAVSLVLYTAAHKMTIPLERTTAALRLQCGQFRHYLGGKRVVMGWNLKNLFSYILGRMGYPLVFDGNVFDLKVMEWYVGRTDPCPANFQEAKSRLAGLVGHKSWPDLKKVMARIYTPLVCRIIPEIESVGVVHRQLKKRIHAHYEIDGQANGRMKCTKGYALGFNPHSCGAEERPLIKPPFFDHKFIYLDFKNMEVNTLQWLSQDPILGKILESDEDVYASIWRMLTGLEGDDGHRKKCKGVFLPVAYGLGAKTLAEKIGVSEETAGKLVSRINSRFSQSMGWLKHQQDVLPLSGEAVDVFGRIRQFLEDKYRVRNFVVQSPASLACLDRLVRLRNDLGDVAKVAFHIHDGYVLTAHRNMVKQARDMAIRSLEAESDLFPKLNLKVACRVGDNFQELQDG
jgi:hypothetical protein